jgi:SpoVK/Ycf46/Vps4 family AAA+-type ATPase
VLYDRFVGESERRLRDALKQAEAMSPIVLWIDEIEKAFGSAEGGGSDSGTTSRIFGTFLTWLNDKKESVFVIATANDISRLPPELLRKGRFDEIFFVDLPNAEVRAEIFTVHLDRKGRPAKTFDLPALAEATEGFSGAEIEQVVLSALYTAFSDGADLTDELLLDEVRATRPLSVTMGEKIAELREWAANRAVPA